MRRGNLRIEYLFKAFTKIKSDILHISMFDKTNIDFDIVFSRTPILLWRTNRIIDRDILILQLHPFGIQ